MSVQEKHGYVGMPKLRSYYGILGITREATSTDIKLTYGMLSLKWHPDKNNHVGAEEKFKEISQAYNVLSDPAKRNKYDDAMESSDLDTSTSADHCGMVNVSEYSGPYTMNTAFSTFAEFMAEGWMRGRFADDDEDYIIVDVPMNIAQAGGNVAVRGPDGKQTKVKVSGFLRSRMRPMLKKTYMWGKDIWLVFRVQFPPVLRGSEKMFQILLDLLDVLLVTMLLIIVVIVIREIAPCTGTLKSFALVVLLIVLTLATFLRVLWRYVKMHFGSSRNTKNDHEVYMDNLGSRVGTTPIK